MRRLSIIAARTRVLSIIPCGIIDGAEHYILEPGRIDL